MKKLIPYAGKEPEKRKSNKTASEALEDMLVQEIRIRRKKIVKLEAELERLHERLKTKKKGTPKRIPWKYRKHWFRKK